MTVDIAAKPTKYRGVMFRSRLEARWALFFSNVGLAWSYEPRAFEIGSPDDEEGTDWYTPDFWLPGVDAFFEIKPTPPSEQSTRKIRGLAELTGRRVFMLGGPFPMSVDHCGLWACRDGQEGAGAGSGPGTVVYGSDPNTRTWEDWDYAFTVCPMCSGIGIEYMGRGERVAERHGHLTDARRAFGKLYCADMLNETYKRVEAYSFNRADEYERARLAALLRKSGR